MISEEMKLILENIKNINQDRLWNSEEFRDKANVINERITEILNPK